MTGTQQQTNFTHIALLVDASLSMRKFTDAVVQVVDSLTEKWAKQSVQLDDMTRLTVYQFSSENFLPNGKGIECIHYDTDITRIKSIEGRYTPAGNTALIDAVLQAQEELALTPTLYADHSFLFFLITDGQENRSSRGAGELRTVLNGLPDNWTMAALVPDVQAKIDANRYGIPNGNIMVWDATSERGVEEAGEKIAAATAGYLTTRSGDVTFKGTKSLFVGASVDAKAVKAASLTPLATKDRKIVVVTKTTDAFEKVVKPVTKSRLKPEMGWFVEIEKYVKQANKDVYPLGDVFYELVKRERVQGDKEIAVIEVNTNKVYVGDGARQLLGLPDHVISVKPDLNSSFKIFIQSNSLNRHLPLHSQIMILNR